MMYVLQAFSLIANLGGQVGLWLGLSMIAVFELVELIADLIIIGVRRFRAHRKAKRETANQWATPSRDPSFAKPEKASENGSKA